MFMEFVKNFESFLDDLDFEKYFYLVEDLIILEEVTPGSVDNPSSKVQNH
jgi:hypothetical protein